MPKFFFDFHTLSLMARKPRLQYEGALYHVTTRGNRRERIVGDERDYATLEEMLIEAMNRAGVRLYAWCLMPNHVHLLVETPDGNLGAFVQRWLTRYAGYFNWRYGLVGHVFQGRYKAKLCQKETYFKQLLRYIHLNPYKVKTPGFVGSKGWNWSSHRFYMGQASYPEGCRNSIEESLLRFGQDPAQARQGYAKFLLDALQEGNWEDFYKEACGDVLGDRAYVESCQAKAMEQEKQFRRDVRKWTLQRLLQAAEEHLHVSPMELMSSAQSREVSRARQAVAYVGRVYGNISVSELAQNLQRDPSAISQIFRRSAKKLRESQEVQTLIQGLGLSICQSICQA